MIDKSLTDKIRNYLSDIDDLECLAKPTEKACQIGKIAQDYGANRDSVASIFNRELKKVIKANGMDENDFFLQRQIKKFNSNLDLTINAKPVQVDDEPSKIDAKSSKNIQESTIEISPKINEELATVTDEDYSNMVTVIDSVISSFFPDMEELTEKDEKAFVASCKLLFGNNPKMKPIIGSAGIAMILKKKIAKAREITKEKEEKEQAKKITWHTEI